MHKKVGRARYRHSLVQSIQRAPLYDQVIFSIHPIAADRELAGPRISCQVLHRVERRTRNHSNMIHTFLIRHDRHIYASLVKHKRRKHRLKVIRSIVPAPTLAIEQRVRERNIPVKFSLHLSHPPGFERCNQLIHIRIHEFRIKAPLHKHIAV